MREAVAADLDRRLSVEVSPEHVLIVPGGKVTMFAAILMFGVGGGWNVGKRISIRHTRNLLNAALEGKLDNVEYRHDKLFGFDVPLSCPDVPEDVLDPSTSWGNKDEYWRRYDALAARYIENFKLFESGCPLEVRAAGPKRLKSVEVTD